MYDGGAVGTLHHDLGRFDRPERKQTSLSTGPNKPVEIEILSSSIYLDGTRTATSRCR